MKGQKEAVIFYVKELLPAFKSGDVALVMLTKDQLELLKSTISAMIFVGEIEYSKDTSNRAEVIAYSRAMVMNHLKKAKELNGAQVYGKSTTQVAKETKAKSLSSINMDLLTEDLKQIVQNLV